MNRHDIPFAILMVVFAAFIWLRDLAWLTAVEDVLPVVVAIPLLLWLGRPWRFQQSRGRLSSGWVALGCVLSLAGIALNMTLLLALAWTTLGWAYLAARLPREDLRRVRRLLPLAIFAFPWIALDAQPVGWWFRLSGAWTAEQIFALIGLNVAREGTLLTVQGWPVSIAAPCAGLNVLQSMLIAGTMVAFIEIGDRKHYWWYLPVLVVLAWMANTSRIVMVCIAALSIGPELAMGSFHFLGGWAILCVMFLLCLLVFSLARQVEAKAAHPT